MRIHPESDAPLILKMSAFRRVYQEVEEPDEEGVVEVLKMRASKEFTDKFNGLIFSILARCIENAREAERTTIWPEDVPVIEEV